MSRAAAREYFVEYMSYCGCVRLGESTWSMVLRCKENRAARAVEIIEALNRARVEGYAVAIASAERELELFDESVGYKRPPTAVDVLQSSERYRCYDGYHWMKRNGICVRCGEQDARKDRVDCEECALKQKARGCAA